VTNLLHIERLSCTYQVARDHPRPESVRSRLDGVAAEQVAQHCSEIIGRMLEPEDPSVWVIDSLDVQFTVDVGAVDTSQVAALWANRIAGSLARAVAAGADESAGVRRFANRAEYLAWLLGLLLAGRPWTSMHTREFEGLRTLPLTGLISEALVREPAVAAGVIEAIVRDGMLERLLGTLTPISALRILSVCAPETDDSQVNRDLWRMALAISNETSNPLEIYLRCLIEAPGASRAAVRSAAERALQFRQALASGEVRAAMRSGNFSLALKAAAAALRPALLLVYALGAGDTEWFAEAVASAGATVRTEDAFESMFGGVFLLLPDLITLYPDASPLFRFVILLKCFGRDLAPAVWRDTALLIASGLEDPVTAEEIALCRSEFDVSPIPGDAAYFALDRILPEPERDDSCSRAAHALMKRFARRFLGLERSSPAYLLGNILSGGATVAKAPGRIVVRVAPRPLQIVLHMAGIHGLTIRPPWLPETEVAIELT
jgi:hypothetical protein